MAAILYGAAEAAAAGEKAGLPQFDPSFFASQLFWLAVIFTILYLVLSGALLPRLTGAIEAREGSIRRDIDAAAAANQAAQQALSGYDQSLAKGRADARKQTDAAREEAAKARAAATAEADAKLTQRIDAAEAAQASARAQGLEGARAAAEDVAAAIVAKLTGRAMGGAA